MLCRSTSRGSRASRRGLHRVRYDDEPPRDLSRQWIDDNASPLEVAHDVAARAAAIGERFEEADLIGFARQQQGRALLRQGHVDRGLALLDEAMVAVTSGELSPVMAGLLYCRVIASCQQVYALDPAHEADPERARWWPLAFASYANPLPPINPAKFSRL